MGQWVSWMWVGGFRGDCCGLLCIREERDKEEERERDRDGDE